MRAKKTFQLLAALIWFGFSWPAVSAEKPTQSSAKAAPQTDIERGRYLVAISGCNDCHTPGFLLQGKKVPQKDWLTGSAVGWRGPWGTTYPANLRLYFQETSEDQWVQVAREIQRRPPMTYYSLNEMAEPDVRAMYKFIRSLGPAGKPAPKFLPPGKVPPQPYVQFPDKLN
jgi:mono/diheme cytochrome c family protein